MRYFLFEAISIAALISLYVFRSDMGSFYSTPELRLFMGIVFMIIIALTFLVFPAFIILTLKPNLLDANNKVSKKEKLFNKNYSFALTGYLIISWILYLFLNRITYTALSVIMSVALFTYYLFNNKKKVGSLWFWINLILIIILIIFSFSLANSISGVR